MKKWINRILVVVILFFVGYVVYDYFAAGFNTRPDMPEGAFSLSYKNGFRAIMLDAKDERDSRRYFGVPFEVPFWAEEAWSYCKSPTKQQSREILEEIDLGKGSRLDAVCEIEADGETILRGAIFTAPKL